jgi:hypothetical protein
MTGLFASFDEILHGVIMGVVGGVIGAMVTGLASLAIALCLPRKKCPDCGSGLPKLRNNWFSLKVFWVCPGCGCAVSSRGRKVNA